VLGQRCLGWGSPQRCTHTAQDRLSSREKWEEHVVPLERSPLRSLVHGEKVERVGVDPVRSGSRWQISASSELSGHGQTLDLGVIDEAWAQIDDRLLQSFRPAMMTRSAAQMRVVSTAGTEQSTFLSDRVEDGPARLPH
jgi:hypothetical protein